MITQREQRKAAKEFAEWWAGKGDEKGQSQTFWLTLLEQVYGVEHPEDVIQFENRVKLDKTSFIDGYIPSTHVLIEQKSSNKDLRKGIRQSDGTVLTPFQQAKRYSIELPYEDRPRWIVISNFKEFHIYDMNDPQGAAEVIQLKDLEEDYYRLSFLVNTESDHINKSEEVSIKAGELVGMLYDALLHEYNDPDDPTNLRYLNMLCVRLVFCFYAEDAGLFGTRDMFHDYLAKFKDSPDAFRKALIDLFKVLDQKEEDRDPYASDELLAFPYVNGGLFSDENIIVPRVNEEIIDIILNKASSGFDWLTISPTIFGGVFESTLNPEIRRSGGMHYTSIENIHKVIDPLFMDELNEEFKEIISLKTKTIREKRLRDFQDKLASLKFLDPAAGSGNFLTETYLSLRRLENSVLKELNGTQIVLGEIHNPIKVSINQFYGIEINDFAVSVAKTALWIAESQMMKETEDIVNVDLDFLPLHNYDNIIEANALRIDWNDVIPNRKLNYIMGNPPFIGARLLNSDQKEDMDHLFKDIKKSGNLDYVMAWYQKAARYIKASDVQCAFVSTSSIVEGEMVSIVWPKLFEQGITINFAHRPFKWNSETRKSAQVYCVIVGFSKSNGRKKAKFLYDGNSVEETKHINAYLMAAPDITISRRTSPICDIPKLHKGCQPTDNGNLIIEASEYEEFVKKEPKAKIFIKKLIGAKEFLNNKDRYCLWLVDATPAELKSMPMVMDRIRKTKEMRLAAKDKGTQKLAATPHLFREQYNYDSYLVIPKLHSKNREYMPMGFFGKDVISTDLNYITENATLYHFGILESIVHLWWTKIVCGRMGNGIRYSAGVVYNNFPWPEVTDKQREQIEQTAQGILDARVLYPDSSLADLYDENTMPPELRKAHQENDKAVIEAYGFDWRHMTEEECVGELMKLYQKLTK